MSPRISVLPVLCSTGAEDSETVAVVLAFDLPLAERPDEGCGELPRYQAVDSLGALRMLRCVCSGGEDQGHLQEGVCD